MSKKQKTITAVILVSFMVVSVIVFYSVRTHKAQISINPVRKSLTEYIRNLEQSGREKGEVIVAVIDSGCNVPEEYKDRLFPGYNFLEGNTGYVKDIAGNYLPACDIETIPIFALETDLERCLGETQVWKAGEAGIVHAKAAVFVDSMEIIYPPEWVAQDDTLADRSFDYTGIPAYEKKEEDLFYIPLHTADGAYTIIVNAYKNGHVKTEELSIVVSGSILDELRTRLR